MSDLELLQVPDVTLTLAHQLPHLVLVLVLLVEPLSLLPLVLLLRELTKTKTLSGNLRRREERVGPGYLFDLLPVLGRAASGVDSEALLEHSHAGLGLATLDLWQSVLLLLLPGFNNLNHPVIVALHLLLLLNPH